jgi:hypothetical protein
MPTWLTALVSAIVALLKGVGGSLMAYLAGTRQGRVEAEKAALVEHAKRVKLANDSRLSGELNGLRSDEKNYRD